MDCLIREAGPYSLGICEYELLDMSAIDPTKVYEMSMAERVEVYLGYPFDAIVDELPDWPLSVFIKPCSENISVIPHVLDRLSLVYLPNGEAIDSGRLLQRSLGTYYRSGKTQENCAIETVEVVAPKSNEGLVKGWISDGVAINAFNCSAEAFQNNQDFHVKQSEPTTIDVVVNDDSMGSEPELVMKTYLNRADDLDIDVTFFDNISRRELIEVFEENRDFVHFIGHCEPGGLQCGDGLLDPSDIDGCAPRTFFLNACNSIHIGNVLIENGASSGIATLGEILDEQAMKIGSEFAKLVMAGFSIDRSLYYARSQTISNHQYVVLGDGTQQVSQSDSIRPMVQYVSKRGKDRYIISYEAAPIHLNGGVYRPFGDSAIHLFGNRAEIELTSKTLRHLLEAVNDPLLMHGELLWPEELIERIFENPRSA